MIGQNAHVMATTASTDMVFADGVLQCMSLIWKTPQLRVQEAEELRGLIEALRSAPSALEAARARREEHAADRAKFAQLLDNLQARAVPRNAVSCCKG